MCCLGSDTFKVKISPLDKKEHIRIHVPAPLDRRDGSFLVRYRLYGTVLTGLKVEVLHQDAAVAKSPYTIQGLCCHALRNAGTGPPDKISSYKFALKSVFICIPIFKLD